MNTTAERLRNFQSSTPSMWREHAESRLANQDERKHARKIAMQILDAMEQQGITEDDLAKRLTITTEELSSILKGHKMPSYTLLSVIYTILGISASNNPFSDNSGMVAEDIQK